MLFGSCAASFRREIEYEAHSRRVLCCACLHEVRNDPAAVYGPSFIGQVALRRMAFKLLALATLASAHKPVFDYTLAVNCPICRQYGNSTVKDLQCSWNWVRGSVYEEARRRLIFGLPTAIGGSQTRDLR